MEPKHMRLTFEAKALDVRKDGGQIIITTPTPDRDKDRVMPSGGNVENYMRNPVVQWGHNYADAWATIGRTTELTLSDAGIVATFELRPPANDFDPQNIVQLLWGGGWIRTASIGFMARGAVPNDMGGLDFNAWELLEWSLVPIPANADALRLAVKSLSAEDNAGESRGKTFAGVALTAGGVAVPDATAKRGRVLSAANEQLITDARDNLTRVLAAVGESNSDAVPAEDVTGKLPDGAKNATVTDNGVATAEAGQGGGVFTESELRTLAESLALYMNTYRRITNG